MRFALFAAAAILALPACAQAPQSGVQPAASPAEAPRAGFVVVGDTGYIPAYERFDDDEKPVRSLGDYMSLMTEDWLERNETLEGFSPTPWVFETALGSFMEASGMYPVALAAREVCDKLGCDFATMVGDNIYPDGATLGADGISDERRFHDMLDAPYGDFGAGTDDFTIYAMMGNHDWRVSRAATDAQRQYLQDHPNFTMPDYFYRAVPAGMEGFLEIFVIDTEMLLASTEVHVDNLDEEGREIRTGEMEEWDDFVKPATPAEREMVSWLEDALATSTARWKIVLGHHAIWSGGGSKFEKAHALRALYMDALCTYADAYISGDDHMIELYTDDCRDYGATDRPVLPAIVSGAGSKYRPLHPQFMANQLENNPGLTNKFSRGSVWGFAYVALDEDEMTVRIYSTPNDMSGRPVEEAAFTFGRRSATPGN